MDHMAYAVQFTGLDLAGPLFVKDGLKSSKCCILLLTWASSRAIHLELVPDMSIQRFLRGFKRFMSRRGAPDLVISENFKIFKSSQRLFHLRKVLKDFWKRFGASYLKELRQMNLYRKVKGNDTHNITIDEVVLIKDDEPVRVGSRE